MKDAISCTRCGNAQSVPLEIHEEWDEISCTECGEFLDTVGHWADSQSPNYSVQILNLKGKAKKYGRISGRRDHTKKAYVCLSLGEEIDFGGGSS